MNGDDAKSANEIGGISVEELVKFLRSIAKTYSNETTGNLKMAKALYELADELKFGNIRLNKKNTGKQLEFSLIVEKNLFELNEIPLQDLALEDVDRILTDPLVRKSQLVRLGAERFKIPVARLTKLKIEAVKDAIRNSIAHEKSLSVIA